MTLKAGAVLHDQYEVIRLLARGGFGHVYEARDTILQEQVALKELIPALVGDEPALKRFLAEAKATIRLTHDRIVRTYGVFRHEENYYIVMEYMAGGSLEQRLRASGPLVPVDAVRVALDVCEGLAYAHERGVVHCDLKPANILFSKDGSAKVADFGIAHVSEQILTRTWHTAAGFAAGTLAYMSPEQAAGVRNDPRVDVYALGAVLYRALTGRTYLDFDEADTPVAAAQNVLRIQSEEPRPPGMSEPSIPDWLEHVVLRALSKAKEERHADAEALRVALLEGRESDEREASVRNRKHETAESVHARLSGEAREQLARDGQVQGAAIQRAEDLVKTRARTPVAEDERLGARSGAARVSPASLPSVTAIGGELPRWAQIGIEMIDVPAGPFPHGPERRPVSLASYRLARTPVTNAQYAAYVAATGRRMPEYWEGGRIPDGLASHPVVCVSWDEAWAFCRWAGCRLPTEKEWEKAARGRDGLRYPWGQEWHAGYCNTGQARYEGTVPVGAFPQGRGPYGHLDMIGNVWEWCDDRYDTVGAYRVIRGGFWASPARRTCNSTRSEFRPSRAVDYVGFRCAL